jgi:hypothetical protein
MAHPQFGQSGMGAAVGTAIQPGVQNEPQQHQTWDAMETYFECITTCSLDDGECVTRCVEQLREQG